MYAGVVRLLLDVAKGTAQSAEAAMDGGSIPYEHARGFRSGRCFQGR
jgi:hypothetical protein